MTILLPFAPVAHGPCPELVARGPYSAYKAATMLAVPTSLFSYRKHWAHRLGPAPFLPMTRDEMDTLGWDSCDVILVTGDAYVDHASFGAAIVGRLLEAQGFRVGILSQPDWSDCRAFMVLGPPNLFFGVTAGNMDSMVNRFTSDRKIRSDDAYTPGGEGGQRPNRSSAVYAQRCREAFSGVPIILGGIEASLRRVAHYDYWSDTVRRSILLDSKADLLVYGNGERAVVELAHRLAAGERIGCIRDLRGTAFTVRRVPDSYVEIDSTTVDVPGETAEPENPYAYRHDAGESQPGCDVRVGRPAQTLVPLSRKDALRVPRSQTVLRLPDYAQVGEDPVLYAHASRVVHLEANPGNARALIQRHDNTQVWLNPPPLPLTTPEMDALYELPYSRRPHPAYGDAKIPAYEMIRFSVTIMRGCFGGCSFCSITEHEGRVIQNRSEDSIIAEVEQIRDNVPGFTGHISDLGGPTANMYRLACKSREIEAACRKPSCVYPDVCENLGTDHGPLIQIYRRARKLKGIKKIFVASGVRYDLAVKSPEYVKELATHHVGGYLKIAPEHTEQGPLSLMMKPGIGSYDRFKELFDRYSEQAGKEQYLIPYFIAAHPGTTDEDMLSLALWLKRNGFRPDQVQAFLPSPMATATAMYRSGKNPLRKVRRDSGDVAVPKGLRTRRLHKAFLRYHDPNNWPMLREALRRMGRSDLVGRAKQCLVPPDQSRGMGYDAPGLGRSGRTARQGRSGAQTEARKGGAARTQHTGLPPLPIDLSASENSLRSERAAKPKKRVAKRNPSAQPAGRRGAGRSGPAGRPHRRAR